MDKAYGNQVIKELDLREVNLYGWEGEKRLKDLLNMEKAIKSGKELPRVYVLSVRNPPNGIESYQLIKGHTVSTKDRIIQMDGGHKRAIAHYHLGIPLPVREIGYNEELDMGFYMPVLIQDIQITDRPSLDEIIKQSLKQ